MNYKQTFHKTIRDSYQSQFFVFGFFLQYFISIYLQHQTPVDENNIFLCIQVTKYFNVEQTINETMEQKENNFNKTPPDLI